MLFTSSFAYKSQKSTCLATPTSPTALNNHDKAYLNIKTPQQPTPNTLYTQNTNNDENKLIFYHHHNVSYLITIITIFLRSDV